MSGLRGMHQFQEQIKAECRKSLSRLHVDSNLFYNENEEESDSVRSSFKGVVNKIRETGEYGYQPIVQCCRFCILYLKIKHA